MREKLLCQPRLPICIYSEARRRRRTFGWESHQQALPVARDLKAANRFAGVPLFKQRLRVQRPYDFGKDRSIAAPQRTGPGFRTQIGGNILPSASTQAISIFPGFIPFQLAI
jgi:hypothetical protein